MKVRHIRTSEVLDDTEVVVRGGDLDADIIRGDARRMHSVYGPLWRLGVRPAWPHP
jgi:hypothetical protein